MDASQTIDAQGHAAEGAVSDARTTGTGTWTLCKWGDCGTADSFTDAGTTDLA